MFDRFNGHQGQCAHYSKERILCCSNEHQKQSSNCPKEWFDWSSKHQGWDPKERFDWGIFCKDAKRPAIGQLHKVSPSSSSFSPPAVSPLPITQQAIVPTPDKTQCFNFCLSEHFVQLKTQCLTILRMERFPNITHGNYKIKHYPILAAGKRIGYPFWGFSYELFVKHEKYSKTMLLNMHNCKFLVDTVKCRDAANNGISQPEVIFLMMDMT